MLCYRRSTGLASRRPPGCWLSATGLGRPPAGDGAAHIQRRTSPCSVSSTGPQIRTVLSESDVFVAPATRESFGIAALEARETGMPVLARLGTGVADFIEHAVHGMLVDSDKEMAKSIRTLAQDRPLLRKLTASIQEYTSGYDWSNATAQADRAYHEAVVTQRRPQPGDRDAGRHRDSWRTRRGQSTAPGRGRHPWPELSLLTDARLAAKEEAPRRPSSGNVADLPGCCAIRRTDRTLARP